MASVYDVRKTNMPKKENNSKNFTAHEAFKKHQKQDRPKQIWSSGIYQGEQLGYWAHLPQEAFNAA